MRYYSFCSRQFSNFVAHCFICLYLPLSLNLSLSLSLETTTVAESIYKSKSKCTFRCICRTQQRVLAIFISWYWENNIEKQNPIVFFILMTYLMLSPHRKAVNNNFQKIYSFVLFCFTYCNFNTKLFTLSVLQCDKNIMLLLPVKKRL